ncbi:MAG: hypothetical protein OES57_02280 [Acidimicrobiia bacterium]|nr:hypothetical protein [Acidimicrobiia bacterium]
MADLPDLGPLAPEVDDAASRELFGTRRSRTRRRRVVGRAAAGGLGVLAAAVLGIVWFSDGDLIDEQVRSVEPDPVVTTSASEPDVMPPAEPEGIPARVDFVPEDLDAPWVALTADQVPAVAVEYLEATGGMPDFDQTIVIAQEHEWGLCEPFQTLAVRGDVYLLGAAGTEEDCEGVDDSAVYLARVDRADLPGEVEINTAAPDRDGNSQWMRIEATQVPGSWTHVNPLPDEPRPADRVVDVGRRCAVHTGILGEGTKPCVAVAATGPYVITNGTSEPIELDLGDTTWGLEPLGDGTWRESVSIGHVADVLAPGFHELHPSLPLIEVVDPSDSPFSGGIVRDGVGPIRLGMTLAEVQSVVDDVVVDLSELGCGGATVPGDPYAPFMEFAITDPPTSDPSELVVTWLAMNPLAEWYGGVGHGDRPATVEDLLGEPADLEVFLGLAYEVDGVENPNTVVEFGIEPRSNTVWRAVLRDRGVETTNAADDCQP